MARKTWLSSLALAALLLASCGDDSGPCPDPGGHCIMARFTLYGGSSFEFVGTSSRPPEGSRWQISAADPDHQPYGISIIWESAQVTAPGKHTPNGTSGAVTFWVTRPNAVDPQRASSTTTRDGTLTFTALGYSPGNAVAGTFEALRLPATSATESPITLTGGTFSALVK